MLDLLAPHETAHGLETIHFAQRTIVAKENPTRYLVFETAAVLPEDPLCSSSSIAHVAASRDR